MVFYSNWINGQTFMCINISWKAHRNWLWVGPTQNNKNLFFRLFINIERFFFIPIEPPWYFLLIRSWFCETWTLFRALPLRTLIGLFLLWEKSISDLTSLWERKQRQMLQDNFTLSWNHDFNHVCKKQTSGAASQRFATGNAQSKHG